MRPALKSISLHRPYLPSGFMLEQGVLTVTRAVFKYRLSAMARHPHPSAVLLPCGYLELRDIALECDHDGDTVLEAASGNLDRLYRLQCVVPRLGTFGN